MMSAQFPFPIIICGVLFLMIGCEVIPEIRVQINNKNGVPVKGTPIIITSSQNIELSDLDKEFLERKEFNKIKSETDENGNCRIAYYPPEEPNFLERMFGAEAIGLQWISVLYEDKSGNEIVCKFYVRPY
jgi:hypothetical protein